MAFDSRVLAGVGIFTTVIETGSFVRAAEALGMSDSGVSRAISRLETRVGVRLIERTTRALRLTDEGARFHAETAPLLDGLADAAGGLAGARHTVQGRLRVDVDRWFLARVLAPRLPEFARRHPRLELELLTPDRRGDLVGEGLDISLRFGPPPNPGAIATKLLDARVRTVAAPAYLDRNGRPAAPEALADHQCLQFLDPNTGRRFAWEFRNATETREIPTRGGFTFTDPGAMLAACRAGAGVAQVLDLGLEADFAAGNLVDLFPDWPGETYPLHAVYLSRRNLPAKIRAFIDFCREAWTARG